MKPVLRVFAAVLPLALAASPALAQRSDQLELGGYASFTLFDRAFLFWNKFRGGTAGLHYFSRRRPQRSGGPATQYQWYWGATGGAFVSKPNKMGYTYGPIVGGHWLITARRTALYVAYAQAIFLGDGQASIAGPG